MYTQCYNSKVSTSKAMWVRQRNWYLALGCKMGFFAFVAIVVACPNGVSLCKTRLYVLLYVMLYLRPLHTWPTSSIQHPSFAVLWQKNFADIPHTNGHRRFGDSSKWKFPFVRLIIPFVFANPMSSSHLMVHCHTYYDELMDTVRVHATNSFRVILARHILFVDNMEAFWETHCSRDLQTSEILASIGPETRCS
jgi:hypothetical protein